MAAHIHAENMKLYAQDAAETETPWDRWEWRPIRASVTEWVSGTASLTWSPENEYRRKPRTHTVNGFEVPEPMREKPEVGAKFYLPMPSAPDFQAEDMWTDSTWCDHLLERGLVHATKEAAIQNAKAMLGIAP